jgi:hypothetical protein
LKNIANSIIIIIMAWFWLVSSAKTAYRKEKEKEN